VSPERNLTVRTADPTAEITVYDASFNRVGRGVGVYEGTHPDGLYQIRIRAVGTQEEKLLSLSKNETVEFGPVAFASPVPLTQTSTSDEAHQVAVALANSSPVTLGAGSSVLITVRDSPGHRASDPGSPAAGLSLIGPTGTPLYDVSNATVDTSGRSSVVAIVLTLNPDVYRLRLALPDGTARERTLVASPGWTTQCFMVRRMQRDRPVPDLGGGSIALSPFGKPFVPNDALARLSEAACDALANYRQIAAAAANALMALKFEDPMLGLLVAHLLVRDTPDAPILNDVMNNLVQLLGPDHPDVQALLLATRQAMPQNAVTQMPMLRASWDAIVTSTVAQPLLVPPGSPAALAAERVLPGAPWLTWEAVDASTVRRVDSKLSALRSYLRRGVESSLPEGTQATSPPPSFSLDSEDREELTRTLGVPNSVLDGMLSKLVK
jgi:hypothetical protein